MDKHFGKITSTISCRQGVISGVLSLNQVCVYIVYPISTAVYLASNQDFITYLDTDSAQQIMIECWNPIFLLEEDLKISDSIQESHIQKYMEFLLSLYTHHGMQDKHDFTGPPIMSTTDVRKTFQQHEKLPYLISTYPFLRVLEYVNNPCT